jgi:hypothetical protein
MPQSVQLNLVVTGGPDGDREMHMADGAFAAGLSDGCRTKLTIPYEVAKSMFLQGDQMAAMQAFMSGQVKVEGDMTQLMAMQGQMRANDAAQEAIRSKLLEITSET